MTLKRIRILGLLGAFCLLPAATGCQDGPLYAIKAANPYYAWGEWKRDTEFGTTDHQRRKELAALADSIGNLPPERQEFWADHLRELMEHDESPEMRRLAIRAAGRIHGTSAVELVEQGLEDESTKVRMEACKSLALRSDDQSARMLAATVGTETDQDVRHAAISALSHHKSAIATDSLRLALEDRNPATQSLVIASLKGATGVDHGDDPQAWIAMLDRTPGESATDRLKPSSPDPLSSESDAGRIAQQPHGTLNR